MSEYILTAVIIAQFIYIAYLNRTQQKERKENMRAIMAKNLREYTESAIIEEQGGGESIDKPLPDEEPIDEKSQIEFEEAIKKHIKDANTNN